MVQILLVVLVGLLIQTVQLAPVEKASGSGVPKSLKVYVNPNSAPFSSKNSIDIANGLDINLLNTIGARLGITLHYKFLTLANMIPTVQADPNSIAISTLSITPARSESVILVSYFNSSSGFLALKSSNSDVKGLSNLCGKTVAVETGSTQEQDVEAQNAKCGGDITILSYDSYSDVVNAVSTGAADVAVSDAALLYYTVTNSGDKLVTVGENYNYLPFGIAVNQGATVLARRIAHEINYLTSKGYYIHILRQSGYEPVPYSVCPTQIYDSTSTHGVKDQLSVKQCAAAQA